MKNILSGTALAALLTASQVSASAAYETEHTSGERHVLEMADLGAFLSSIFRAADEDDIYDAYDDRDDDDYDDDDDWDDDDDYDDYDDHDDDDHDDDDDDDDDGDDD